MEAFTTLCSLVILSDERKLLPFGEGVSAQVKKQETGMESWAQSRRVGCGLSPRNKKGLRYGKSGAPSREH